MKNVLVTGINGFVGSALAERLFSLGIDRVVGIVRDRNFKSRKDILDRASIVYGDITDFDLVRRTMSCYEIDTVFHVAAVTILRQSVLDPVSCFNTNIMGTVSVLEAARQCKVSKIVCKSSDKAYGTYEELPYVETMHVQSSADPYSTSKACMDLVSQSYSKGYDMDVSILRSGNIYGPGDLNLSRVIPRSVLRCFEGKSPQIYKGVGEYKREFMYISDVVDAYLTIADRGVSGEAYNIGGSGYQTVYETVNKIIAATGFCGSIDVIDADFKEIKEQYLDSSKIEKLGWKCKHGIDEGLDKTVEWYKGYMKNKSEFCVAG